MSISRNHTYLVVFPSLHFKTITKHWHDLKFRVDAMVGYNTLTSDLTSAMRGHGCHSTEKDVSIETTASYLDRFYKINSNVFSFRGRAGEAVFIGNPWYVPIVSRFKFLIKYYYNKMHIDLDNASGFYYMLFWKLFRCIKTNSSSCHGHICVVSFRFSKYFQADFHSHKTNPHTNWHVVDHWPISWSSVKSFKLS